MIDGNCLDMLVVIRVHVCVCPCQHTCEFSLKLSECIFSPPMMMLLVSEAREETIQPDESHGGEHKEVGLPPTGALLAKVH